MPLRQAVGLLVTAVAANGGSTSLDAALDLFADYARNEVGPALFARKVRHRSSRNRPVPYFEVSSGNE